MIRTIRYAARQLRKNPTFTLVAVVSLALGIGATSGMFSVADALLFRPLPVPQPANVVHVENCAEGASEFRRFESGNIGKPPFGFPGFPRTGISIAVLGIYFPSVRPIQISALFPITACFSQLSK